PTIHHHHRQSIRKYQHLVLHHHQTLPHHHHRHRSWILFLRLPRLIYHHLFRSYPQAYNFQSIRPVSMFHPCRRHTWKPIHFLCHRPFLWNIHQDLLHRPRIQPDYIHHRLRPPTGHHHHRLLLHQYHRFLDCWPLIIRGHRLPPCNSSLVLR